MPEEVGFLTEPEIALRQITTALEQGVPDTHVAELLGHASTAMIHRHYGHLAARSVVLRASLGRVRGGHQAEGPDRGQVPGSPNG